MSPNVVHYIFLHIRTFCTGFTVDPCNQISCHVLVAHFGQLILICFGPPWTTVCNLDLHSFLTLVASLSCLHIPVSAKRTVLPTSVVTLHGSSFIVNLFIFIVTAAAWWETGRRFCFPSSPASPGVHGAIWQ